MTTPLTFAPVQGLVAAPFTAFHSDGSIDLPTINKQCQSLVADGVAGAFVCGTTGEGLSLTITERKQIAEAWMAAAPSDFKVIVHVGHNSLQHAQELATHAAEIGAFGIGAFPPFFFHIPSAAMLASICEKIASAAPDLPFYYYHIPSMTGVDILMRDFLKEAHDLIPNLAGIKFSHTNLMDLRLAREFADQKYVVLFGSDEILISAMALGVKGGVGSTYNYAAPLYHKMMAAFEAGQMEEAHSYQFICMEMVEVLHRYGNGTTVGKVILKHLGVDCGPCRLPLQTFSPQMEAHIISDLASCGFWQALDHV